MTSERSARLSTYEIWRRVIWTVINVGLIVLLGWLFYAMWHAIPQLSGVYPVPAIDKYSYTGLRGPTESTPIDSPAPTDWQTYSSGSTSRLAILLTGPDSHWLGLAHGLKSIGVPFIVTTDMNAALRHRVVVAYPIASGAVVNATAATAIDRFVRKGGTFVAFNDIDAGLQPLFGIATSTPSHDRAALTFDRTQSVASELSDPMELRVRVSDPRDANLYLGTYGYTTSAGRSVARFDDGSVGIVENAAGKGKTYAIGVDLGTYILKGYDNREQNIATHYINDFEPGIDVFLRVFRAIYRQGQPDAVTLGTVPNGKRFTVLIAHDVDSGVAMGKALDYATADLKLGVPATFFIQPKYIEDYNDKVFFDVRADAIVKQLAVMGMEVASHSVSHSQQFATFPVGTGTEVYPDYEPFIADATRTYNGTVMGELRVSKFLLEHFAQESVVSFDSNDLSDPPALPESAAASGYHYTSTTTADDSLTHLPFQLDAGRQTQTEVPIFEFPVTIEDQALPRIDEREPDAESLSDKIARYGGLVSLLIRPNVTSYNMDFEQRYVDRYRSQAYFSNYRDFGDWWAARNAVGVDESPSGADLNVTIDAPAAIDGLSLVIPAGWHVKTAQKAPVLSERGQDVLLGSIQGTAHLLLARSPAANVKTAKPALSTKRTR